jgi:hypothetical protein
MESNTSQGQHKMRVFSSPDQSSRKVDYTIEGAELKQGLDWGQDWT